MQDTPIRLLADGMLGRLARWLRLLGYDTAYDNRASHLELAHRSRAEGRVLLTRDQALATRRGLKTLLIRSESLEGQVSEVVVMAGPPDREAFTRCAVCNAILQPVDRDSIKDRLPPYVAQAYSEFRLCPKCNRLYWPGTHYQEIVRRMSTFDPWDENGPSDEAAAPSEALHEHTPN